jgi:hypothetical protein
MLEREGEGGWWRNEVGGRGGVILHGQVAVGDVRVGEVDGLGQ